MARVTHEGIGGRQIKKLVKCMLDFAVMIGYAGKKRNRSNALDFLSKSQPICLIAEVETDMHSNIFLQELKQEVSEGKAALGMETGAGCGSLRVDQCTHSVWLLTLSLPASSLCSVIIGYIRG